MANIDWESRAKERRLENKAVKKRLKEMTISRDEWKIKYMNQKEILDGLRRKLDAVKKNVQKISEI
jgi:hypothetical protein